MPQPWPYNQIREPRPADWGIGMTVCIASIVLNEGIVCVSDAMLSTGDMSADRRTLKFKAIGRSWMAMFSGDDISSVIPILRNVDDNMQGDDQQKLENVSGYFADAYKRQLNRQSESEILGPLGMSLEEFRTKGLKQLGAEVFGRLLYDIQNVRLSLELLVCGYDADADGDKTPHIFTVSNPGSVNYVDLAAFWAIGSGQTSALGHLFNLHTPPKYKSLPDAMYCACEAKFHAESAPGVGEATTALVLKADGSRFLMRTDALTEIRRAWKSCSTPDVPAALEGRLEKIVKIEEQFEKDKAKEEGEASTKESALS
jgi:20S proteasome alpha/beta subunit